MEHVAVNQSAVVGVPDDTTGTAVVLYVVLEVVETEGKDLCEAIRGIVGEVFGKLFCPREVRFVDAFPKTQIGKIIRRAIETVHRGEELGDMRSIEIPICRRDRERALIVINLSISNILPFDPADTRDPREKYYKHTVVSFIGKIRRYSTNTVDNGRFESASVPTFI